LPGLEEGREGPWVDKRNRAAKSAALFLLDNGCLEIAGYRLTALFINDSMLRYFLNDFECLGPSGVSFPIHIDMEAVAGTKKRPASLVVDDVVQVNFGTFLYISAAFIKFCFSHISTPF